jgi:hypothetical protein
MNIRNYQVILYQMLDNLIGDRTGFRKLIGSNDIDQATFIGGRFY